MPPLKNIKKTNTQVMTGLKVVNAIRTLEDPQGSSVSKIRKCVASRLQLDRIPDQEELKVLLDEAVKRGALAKIGRKYKIMEKEKNKKIAGEIAKRGISKKSDAKSKLAKKIKLDINSKQVSQSRLVLKRHILKIGKNKKHSKVTEKAKKRQRTEKSDGNEKEPKKRSQNSEKDGANSEEIHQSQQMPEGSVSKAAEEEKNRNVADKMAKHQSTEQKLNKERKLDANKANVNYEDNQPSVIPEKDVLSITVKEKNKNGTGEATKRQRTVKCQQRSKKSSSSKRSRSSKKSDANSEDTRQLQPILERDALRADFTATVEASETEV